MSSQKFGFSNFEIMQRMPWRLSRCPQTSYGDLCPFSVALLLSVARIQRYEEQVRSQHSSLSFHLSVWTLTLNLLLTHVLSLVCPRCLSFWREQSLRALRTSNCSTGQSSCRSSCLSTAVWLRWYWRQWRTGQSMKIIGLFQSWTRHSLIKMYTA